MLALIGLIVFVVADVLHLTGRHGDWLLWLILAGGTLYGLELAWGWGVPRWAGRNRPQT